MAGIHIGTGLPTVAHTYDFLDPEAAIFIDPRQPGAATVPEAAFRHPGMDVIEVTSCIFDLRCGRPGRRGCRSKPYAVQSPGVPELIVIQHEKSCPWLEACLARASAPARQVVFDVARISPGALQGALAEIAAAKGREITFSGPGEPWYVNIEGAGQYGNPAQAMQRLMGLRPKRPDGREVS